MDREIELGAFLDLVAEEINTVSRFRGDSDRSSHRFVDVAIDRVGDERSMVAENNIVWRLTGSSFGDSLQGGQEAHVQHAVGFVDNDRVGAGKIDQTSFQIVAQTAGVAITTSAPALTSRNCLAQQTAHHNGGADTHACSGSCRYRIGHRMADFACGTQDKDFDCFAAGTAASASIIGMANAGILPVPVCAVATTTSWPFKSSGMAWAGPGRWGDEFVPGEVVLQCGAD